MSAQPAPDGKGEGDLPLDFEAWANLSARLLQLGQDERFDVLEQRGIDPADWARCDEHHYLALAADLGAGRMDRAQHYGKTCAAELERRRCEPPPAPAETAATQAPAPAQVEPVQTAGAPAAAPVVAAASFQKDAPPPPPVQKAPPSFAGTMNVEAFPSFLKQGVGVLPFAGTSSPQSVAGPSPPRGPAPNFGATLAPGAEVPGLMGTSLPFGGQGDQAGPPLMPLPAYASLCAELIVAPDRRADILKAYGVEGEEALRVLEAGWEARFSRHRGVHELWQKSRATYEEWLRNRPR